MLRITLVVLALVATGFEEPATQSAPEKLEFEVASIKPNTTPNRASNTNVPLGPGNVFTPTGGYLSVVNMPLTALIGFAYKITGDQEQYLRSRWPDWALAEHFDVEARAAGNPTKEEMRSMVRALLADRCKLAVHYETKEAPVVAMVLAKPGKTGPRLRQHPDDSPCTTVPDWTKPTFDDGYPLLCGGLLPLPHGPGRIAKFGASNVTLTFMASQLSIMGQLGRRVVDRTGLSGNVDFTLEWSPDSPNPTTAEAELLPGLTFKEAVSEQLGLKLVSQTGPVELLIVDHVERPSGN
jgi:uncharacterized protein (TIGR03435 family)